MCRCGVFLECVLTHAATKAIKVAAHPFQAKEQTSPPRKVRRKPASSTSPQKVAARAANPTPTGSPSKGKTVKNPPPETHVSQQISTSASRLAPASDEFGVVVSTTDRTSTSSNDSKIFKKEHRRSLGATSALADVKEDNEPLVVMEVKKLAPVREDAERTTECKLRALPRNCANPSSSAQRSAAEVASQFAGGVIPSHPGGFSTSNSAGQHHQKRS